ncbi:alpha/beta hydrolase [uncultured Abyssibacter sp.]|uniref:alpha/beta fold hydrolase n=1 Tax=uncultured Abyssibacter sp. TaxID=2320202 RepID=UPI0032B28BF0
MPDSSSQPIFSDPSLTATGGEFGFAPCGELELAYERIGDRDAPAVLLVMGLGSQLVLWPDALCLALVDAGYQVIRFDNRDVGLSSKLDGVTAPGIPELVIKRRLGLSAEVPYTISTMADDAVALMDALDIEQAHVVGASMGGMITQVMAATRPRRVLSAALIMTTTGHRKLRQPSLALQRRLIRKRPKAMDEAIAQSIQTYRLIGSTGFEQTDEEIRAKIERQIHRNVYPAGTLRQLTAIVGSPHRGRLVKQIRQPCLILHGRADPLVPVEAAFDLKDKIRHARLDVIDGWGHDFPNALVPRIADSLVRHLDAAEQR